jgi:5-methylcytosine-specific restriction endonuclease McrA
MIDQEAYRREYYHEHAEAMNQRHKEWLEENVEQQQAYGKRYREERADQEKARKRAYYRKNAKKMRKKAKRNRKRNPGPGRRGSSARRARRLNQFVEHVDTRTAYDMHGGMCGICFQYIEVDWSKDLRDQMHIDHVIPLSQHGPHCYANVRPTHPKCNLTRPKSRHD